MFFDNLSRYAGVHPRGDPAKQESRRAAGEVLIPRTVREKDLALSRYAGVTLSRSAKVCFSKDGERWD
jgi:hypothetical protein